MKTACYKMARPLIFMLLIMMAALFLSTDSVGASSIPTAGNAAWLIEVNVDKNKINVDWIVYGNNSKGRFSERTRLQCTSHGNVIVTRNKAIFDGQSYISCDVPSFAQKAEELAEITLDPRCNCKQPFAEAKTMHGGTHEDPIFYYQPNDTSHYESIQFFTTWDAQQQSRLEFVVPGEKTTSSPFMMKPSWNKIRSEHTCDSGRCFFKHWFQNSNIDTIPTPTKEFLIATWEAQLFIGYSPENNTYFNGEMQNGSLDPGCFPG